MTVDELIEALEGFKEEHGGETPVRLMNQQQWPFEYKVDACVSLDQINEYQDEEGKRGFTPAGRYPGDDNHPEAVVYLVEGSQLGYGTKAAWDAC